MVKDVESIYLFLNIIMAGLAGLLFLVSCISWYRIRSLKIALVSLAFAGFFIKAILLIFRILLQDEKAVVIDSIILILLYFSIIKK